MAHSQRQSLKSSRRQPSYGSMDESKEQYLSPKSAERSRNRGKGKDNDQRPTKRDKPKKFGELSSCSEFCQWIRSDTFKKIKLTWFFISIFIPIILFAAYYILETYDEIIYIIAGAYGILFNIYGFNHFRLLFNLKHEVDAYTKLNDQFRMERQEIDSEINKLSKAGDELNQTHVKLHTNNLKMVDMIRKFESLEQQLTSINAESYDILTNISSKSHHIKDKYYDISLQQQRNILWKVFDRLERSSSRGLTKQMYEEFYGLLPVEHQQRFERLGGFQGLLQMSHGGASRSYIDADDFEKALDIYAQMHVENCDIKFRIEKRKSSKTQQSVSGKAPKYVRKVTILEKKRTEGFYLTKRDIWDAARSRSDSAGSRSPTPQTTAPELFHQSAINE